MNSWLMQQRLQVTTYNMAAGLEGKGSGPLFDGFFGVVNLQVNNEG